MPHSPSTSSQRRERIQSWLRSRRLPWIAAATAIALCAPALWGGLQTEDYAQGNAARALPWFSNLFGSPHTPLWANYLAKDRGELPWIASPHLDIAFWRPIASLAHQIDWALWPAHPWLMHLHSILWLAAMVFVCALLYRRLLAPPWVAGLATLMFAVADSHSLDVSWIANRNALIGAVFALSALLAYDAWRRRGFWPGALLAPLCLALGLGSNELTVGIAGYFVAYAVSLDRARVHRRLVASLPWLAVVVVWATLYKLAGYGAHGSGVYFDPLTQPLAFLNALPQRFSGLALGLLAGPTSSLWYLALGHAWGIALGAAFLLLFVAAVVPLLRRDAHARFWALGMLLSMLPACATSTSDRLLILPGVGAFALIAQLLGAWVSRSPALPGGRRWRVPLLLLGGELLLMHVLLAPVFLPVRVLLLHPYEAVLDQARLAAYDGLRSPAEDVVVLNAPDYYFGTLLVSTRTARREPVALHTRVLYGGFGTITVTRMGAHTLRVRAPHGFLQGPFDRVYRSASEPMRAGQGLQLTGAQIVVVQATPRGEPTAIDFRSVQPLDRLRIIAWNGRAYARFSSPPLGASRVVPRFKPSLLADLL